MTLGFWINNLPVERTGLTLWEWIARLFHRPPAPPEPDPEPIPASIVHLLDALNEVRADHMLPPFLADAKLDMLATDWAEAMRRSRILSHGDTARRIWSVYPGRSYGENIALNGGTAEDVVEAWMNSPPHRQNILNPDFVHAGCGRSDIYWCVDFLG